MSGSLIAARADFDALAARLTARARQLAAARLQARAMAGDERRWRRADLLWPLFAKG